MDAAAAVIDRVGPDELTTTLVAVEAAVSVGTVYRYFPDRLGIIVGIRTRCAQQLRERLADALDAPHFDWSAILSTTLQVLADAYRNIPAFRAVTTHDWFGDGTGSLGAQIVDLGRTATRSTGQPVSDPPAGLPGVLRIADALTRSAFEREPDGDPETLALARRLAHAELRGVCA